MPHELQINWQDPKELEQKALDETGYGSPIRNWVVTTEGDEEGRSPENLGVFYGHVAEIAFHLAKKCGYSLCFRPFIGPHAEIRNVLNAVKKKVNISFDANAPAWLSGSHPNFVKIAKWFDVEGVSVKECNYYGAVTLEYTG
jgi:hypothetical protein